MIFYVINYFLLLLFHGFFIQPPRINPIDRIVPAVGIQVHAVDVAGRVRLEEPAQIRAVVPETVVVQARGAVPATAGKQIRIADNAGAGAVGGYVFGQPILIAARRIHHPRPSVRIIGVTFLDLSGTEHTWYYGE